MATRGERSVDVHPLDRRQVAVIGRSEDTSFLRSVRTSRDGEGRFVDHEVSLLALDDFRLLSTFGGWGRAPLRPPPTPSPPREVTSRRSSRLAGLDGAGPDQPVAAGTSAGSVTDDTEQAVLLRELLLEGDGHVEPRRCAEALPARERSTSSHPGELALLRRPPSRRR